MNTLPLVLIGGWGIHVAAVAPLAEHWAGRVDLLSLHRCGGNLSPRQWLESQLPGLPERAVWAGWSLGGQLAMLAASLVPERVAGVVTCCASPCFVERPDWAPGMSAVQFSQFRERLMTGPERAWRRFLLLQVVGGQYEAAGRQAWQPWLKQGPPDSDSLFCGLDWLATLDQRPQWSTLALPRLHIFGGADRLVAPTTAAALKEQPGQNQLEPGMAHWPFGAHGKKLARRLAVFGEELPGAPGGVMP